MRQGEILALRWHDAGLGVGSVYVNRTLSRLHDQWLFAEPKTARSRRKEAARAILVGGPRQVVAKQGVAGALLFGEAIVTTPEA